MYYDQIETKEKFDKIVEKLGFKKHKWLHCWNLNVVTVKLGNFKNLIKELEGIEQKGKLIDYFFRIANAQKVELKPSAVLFPFFALLLLLIHMIEPHFDLKSMLQFDM